MNTWSLFVSGDRGLDFILLVLFQITAVWGLAWFLARGRSAIVRSKVWTGALVACLCGPVLIGVVELSGTSVLSLESPVIHVTDEDDRAASPPRLEGDVSSDSQPSRTTLTASSQRHATNPAQPPAEDVAVAPGPSTVSMPATESSVSIPSMVFAVLVAIWALGVLAGCRSIRKSEALVARIKESARPVNLEDHALLVQDVRQALGGAPLPVLAVSDEIPQPLTLGGRGRQMVVLPSELMHALSPAALRDVLVHECAHVLHGDLNLGWLQSAFGVLYWPHPAAHAINRQLSIAREELCDNRVLAGGVATDYARTLVSLCERPHLDTGLLTCGLLPSRWSMEHRVRGLLDHTRSLRVRMRRGGPAVLLAALIAVSGVIGGTRFDHAEQEADAETSAGPNAVSFNGEVVGPDGSPAVGVAIHVQHSSFRERPKLVTRSDAKGRFEFEFQDHGGTFLRSAMVVARQPGFGVAWQSLAAFQEGARLTLVKDRPIEGRILNLEGQPVEGVSLHVAHVYASENESLDAWLAEIKKDSVGFIAARYAVLPKRLEFWFNPGLLEGSTDSEGRFVLRGVGTERLATLRVRGDNIVSQELHVMTRHHAPLQQNHAPHGPDMGVAQIYGHKFEHYAAAPRIVTGVVRDKENGQPVAGATINARLVGGVLANGLVDAITDDKGMFRLVGLPKGEGNEITVKPKPGDPYFRAEVAVPDTAGVEPISMNISLERGLVLSGRVIEHGTKDGVVAYVNYIQPGSRGRTRAYTKPDGSFRIVVRKGPGFLTAGVRFRSREYVPITERIDLSAWRKDLGDSAVRTLAGNAGTRLNVASEPRPVELTVVRGRNRTIRFFDPDGKPLRGVRVRHANGSGQVVDAIPGSHYVLSASAPSRTHSLLFQHRERGLVAFLKLDPKMPDTTDVTLVPGGRIEGRLVDEEGKPRSGVRLTLNGRVGPVTFWGAQLSTSIHTDSDGRFVLEGLVPEISYSLDTALKLLSEGASTPARSVFYNVTVKTGQERKLGDVKAETDR